VSLRQEHWLLLRALERLSLEMQVAIGLHYVEGLRAREVAEALEVPVSTITTRLSRARAALQREVETLRAPVGVRETLAADLDNWVRSLGPAVGMLPAAR
jgi:RNA polymerase sigma-70 factor (ECF subfamily)